MQSRAVSLSSCEAAAEADRWARALDAFLCTCSAEKVSSTERSEAADAGSALPSPAMAAKDFEAAGSDPQRAWQEQQDPVPDCTPMCDACCSPPSPAWSSPKSVQQKPANIERLTQRGKQLPADEL